jgi:hypothetical protein
MGRTVSLGSSLEQNEELTRAPDAFASKLDPDLKRPLVDLLQTAGPWIRRFPTARKLDEDHAAFQSQTPELHTAESILQHAREGDVVTSDDAEILDAALQAGRNAGVQSKKAGNWGVMSVRNLIFGAVAISVTGIASGAFKHIGDDLAGKSKLAKKATELLLNGEDALLKFVEGLPADMRSIVRALIDGLKAKE